MFGRVIFAAILGAIFVFATGAAEHMFLHWGDRHFRKPVSVEAVKTAVPTLFPEPGLYKVPPMPTKPMFEMSEAEQNAWKDEIKKGPIAQIVVSPPFDDTSMMRFMAMELGSNFVCALLVSIILAMTRPSVGFFGRWFAAVLIGVFAWASLSVSYFIWYGYPWAYIQDELMCQALEWAVGGFIIAAIVRPKDVVRY